MSDQDRNELTSLLADRLTEHLNIMTDKSSSTLGTVFNLVVKGRAFQTPKLLRAVAETYGIERSDYCAKNNEHSIFEQVASAANEAGLSTEAEKIQHYADKIVEFRQYTEDNLYQEGDGEFKRMVSRFKAPKLIS